MKIDLFGKTACVTGAARGIGRDIAMTLSENGAKVIGIDLDKEGLEELKTVTKEETFILDVSDFNAVNGFKDEFLAKYEKCDILVNNAGITRDNLLMRMTENEWDKVLSVNLKSAFNMVSAFSRTLIKQKSGTIVNIASVIGIMGNAGQANYAASKGGLIAFTKSVAKEFASRGVTANAIAPGFIETKMTQALPENVREEYMKFIPLKKFGTPKDVAGIVLFLSSDLAKYVTGQVINCDGGMIM